MPQLTFRQRLTYAAHLYKALTKRHHAGLRPLLAQMVKPDAVIFDIGANTGSFTHIFSKLAPQGRIYAFEPGSYALSILHRVMAWRCGSNVTLLQYGLSDKTESLELHLPVKKSGGVGHGIAHIGHDAADSRATLSESIPLRRMDDVAAELNLQRLDFVKIDVEGWEMHVLKGGAETLARLKPVIMLEMVDRFLRRSGSSSDELLAFLRGLGYQIHRLNGKTGEILPLDDAAPDAAFDIVAY